jgi:FKBP-type peptidyl-prolyl cis-trans isomerase
MEGTVAEDPSEAPASYRRDGEEKEEKEEKEKDKEEEKENDKREDGDGVLLADNDQQWVELMGEGIQIIHLTNGAGETAEMGTIVSCNLTGYFGDDIDREHPFESLRDQVLMMVTVTCCYQLIRFISVL